MRRKYHQGQRHKSELLRAAERNLFWDRLNDMRRRLELAYLHRQNRQTAKKLERMGML